MKFSKMIIAATAILGITTAHAGFGVKAGLGYASVRGDKVTEATLDEGILSPMVGITYHLTFGPIGVKPEIMLEKKGAKGQLLTIDNSVSLWYLDAPLLGSFSVLPTLSIIAGPSVGYLLSAESTFGGVTTDTKDNCQTINVGAVAGLQFMLPIVGLGIDARYQYGFTNVSKISGYKMQTDAIQLTATYLF